MDGNCMQRSEKSRCIDGVALTLGLPIQHDACNGLWVQLPVYAYVQRIQEHFCDGSTEGASQDPQKGP